MSGNNNVMALWQAAGCKIATNIHNYSSGNILGVGISPGENAPAGKDFGFSGYAEHLVLINPQGTHVAEYPVKQRDLSPGRHSVMLSDGTCFTYTVIGSALANADALISAINISFDIE